MSTTSSFEPSFFSWYPEVFRRYAEFSGRARRKEYWSFFAINVLVFVGAAIADSALFGGTAANVFTVLYALASVVPGLAVTVRRLHDTGKSGWMILLNVIPIVGPLLLLWFMLRAGDPNTNKYGDNPKARGDEHAVGALAFAGGRAAS